jgi:hypothetical protein
MICYNSFIVLGMCNVLIKYLGMKVWGWGGVGVVDKNMADEGEVALFYKNTYYVLVIHSLVCQIL